LKEGKGSDKLGLKILPGLPRDPFSTHHVVQPSSPFFLWLTLAVRPFPQALLTIYFPLSPIARTLRESAATILRPAKQGVRGGRDLEGPALDSLLTGSRCLKGIRRAMPSAAHGLEGLQGVNDIAYFSNDVSSIATESVDQRQFSGL
jgi:hypothetical protein